MVEPQEAMRAHSAQGGSHWLRRADKEARRERYADAIASLARAVGAGADAYSCTLRIAEMYRSLGDESAALRAAEAAAKQRPELLPARELILSMALERGDFARAIETGRSILKSCPRHIGALDALGAAYVQSGDVEAAIRVANALIRIDPEAPVHRFKKALLCQHYGDVSQAVQEFTQAILLDPSGTHAADAREALENLDTYQLNQIVTLAIEDTVFRVKLTRDAVEAVEERGFCLSETGKQILLELGSRILPDFCEPCRSMKYN
jgi:tetratricopeptide (TPR) repeat protein